MEKVVTIDKVNAYLNARFFPWNFILEPVDDYAIRHYIKSAIRVALKKAETLDPKSHFSIRQSILDETKNIANDYLIDPYSDYAEKIHESFTDDYPFAYAQCYVYSMLFALMVEVEDLVDIESLLEVMGISKDSFKNKKDLISELMNHCRKETFSGIPTNEIIGRKVIYRSNATEFGVLHDVILSTNQSVFLELIVKPIKPIKDKKLPFKKVGRFVHIPADEVRLTNAFNNYIVIDY